MLASDGHYYMYGTGGVVDGFACYSSDDLVHWHPEGQVYRGNTPESWAVANFWAPEVYERNGKFYLFFSADWKENPEHELENFRIGVAVAEWESRSVTSGEVNRRWTEGSFTLKKGNTYYIMYSANFFGGKNYAVGYATADSPLGPYVKAANNPVLEKNVGKGGIVTGTGHNSVTWSRDGKRMFCVYHGRTAPTGEQRVVFIDPMEIDGNGVLKVNGPTTIEQKIRL